MYTIIKLKNGKFHCAFRLQDGTDRYTEDSLESAIELAKLFAKAINGTKIKRKDITFLQEEQGVETRYIPWRPK